MVILSKAPRGNRIRNSILAICGGIFVASACGEGALRFLLFNNSDLAHRLGRHWRHMELFTSAPDADYWKLQSMFNRDIVAHPPNADPLLGWTGIVEPYTYVHPDESKLGNRTPILLYGDSNAQCNTGPEDCFQGLMERSDLADRYELLNYGVGGYGLDQILGMLCASIDRFADKNPIVIVSFMVDDDLERSMLPFRGWPKPLLGVEDGALISSNPVDSDASRYLEQHPPRITSYLYRLVRNLWHPFDYDPPLSSKDLAARRELNRAILERIRHELERRSLRFFFLVFQMDGSFAHSHTAEWSQAVVDEFMSAHSVPCVYMKPYVMAVTGSEAAALDNLIGRNDPVLMNHFNPAGNRLVFDAIRQGLEGRFDDPDLDRIRQAAARGTYKPAPPVAHTLTVLGVPAGFRADSDQVCVQYQPTVPGKSGSRLTLRCGDDGKLRFEMELGGSATRIRARVRAAGIGEASCTEGELKLAWRTDSQAWKEETFTIGDIERGWMVYTKGNERLELRLTYAGSDPACAWLLLNELERE